MHNHTACHIHWHLENPELRAYFAQDEYKIYTSPTKWIGLNSFWSFSWRNSLLIPLMAFFLVILAWPTDEEESLGLNVWFSFQPKWRTFRHTIIRWSESSQSVPEIFLKVMKVKVLILWYSPSKVRNYGKETTPERQIVSLIFLCLILKQYAFSFGEEFVRECYES